MTEKTAATPALEKKQAQPKPNRVVRWIRRRHRILTFIGALIVFGTFVVKDALRDQLKDALDAMHNGAGFNMVRDDTRRIRAQHAWVALSVCVTTSSAL